ncbi:MAG: S-layer homology domain-containing protein, partial [Vallitaleaceae bacterium]|nr:S-layer homology domain-containing protein [Vallitaleaceae bacterium]
MKSRLISILLSVCIVFSSLSISIYATENTNNQMFKDVSPKDWFYEAVHQAVKENLFTGTSMDSFSPNSSITRGMYVTILGRIAQIDPKDSKDNFSFSDLEKGAYYVPYVMWAVEKGITQGVGGGKFAPDKILTREQMATMTLRFFDAYGITYPEKAVSTLPKDFDMISPWAQEAVMKLWSYGLFQGDEKGNFNPTKQATRAEAAAFSLRVNEKIEQYNEELAAVDELNENRYDDVVSESNSTVAYYRINFVSNGGSDTTSFLRREGGDLSNLPVPYKEGAIFGGWYYDQELTKLIGSKDLLRKDLTLYAKWMDAVPLAETENLRFASAMDQRVDFTINVLGLQSMTAQEVKDSIQVTNFNTQEEKDWIEVTKNGEEFLVSGIRYTGENGSAQNGFYEGTSYQLSLKNEQLQFDGLPQETRDYNFSIIKEDVLNLSLNNDMKFLEFSEISNIIENGVATDRINATPLAISQNGVGAGDLVEGTFTYTQGILVVGDTLAIYEGIHPSERILDDERVGADGDVAYVTITSVNGTSYGYKTADMEKVLFTPDVLPVSIEADTDGSTTNHSITVALSTFDYSDDAYGIIGLDSQTTVDIGDYISFYEGDLLGVSNEGDEPKQVSQDYAVIKTIDLQGDMYIITYDSVSLESMLATMDMYNTDPVDGDEMLENIDVAAYEEKIEQQAMDSGFVEQAGQYLAAMAIETKAFTEITEDFELRNFEILNQNGEPLSPDEIRLMEDGGMKVEVEVEQPEATLGTTLQQFEGLSGLRLTLKIEATITIGPKTPEDGDGQVEITLTGEFEEEVRIAINIDGGARWKWWAIFPYIAEYEVTANVDLLNYTGLKFHASIVTKEFSDDEWTEDEELKNVV